MKKIVETIKTSNEKVAKEEISSLKVERSLLSEAYFQLKKTTKELEQKNRALHMHSESNQAIIRAADENKLLNSICDIIVKTGGYRLAWIGYVENDEEKSIHPMAQAGFEDGYVAMAKLSWGTSERGLGPSGTAIRSGKPVVIRNIQTDKKMAPWRADALKRGYKSQLSLPLSDEKQVLGMLSIYSTDVDAFDDDEVKMITEFANDISIGIASFRTHDENKKIQAALIVSEVKYRSLFETSKDGILIVEASSGKVIEINYSLVEMLGYGPNEFIRRKIWEIELFKKIVADEKQFNKFKEKKYKRLNNLEVKTRNGRTLYMEFVSNLYPVDRAGVIQCNFRDNTDRYKLEEKMNQSEAKYSALVEQSSDGVIVAQDGIIKFANRAAQKMLGYSAKEVVNEPLFKFIVEKYREMIRQRHAQRLRGLAVVNRYEFQAIRKDGQIIDVEANSSLIDFEGNISNMAIIRDITQAKKIDRMKSEFISIASHQLRSPLTGIKWFGQLLVDGKAGRLSAKQLDFVQQITISNDRMIHLVNDLLNVSRIETGRKFTIEKKEQNVMLLIQDVVKEHQINYPKKKIVIEPDKFCGSSLILPFDYEKMYQVFSNLISNAIKYSDMDTELIIGCKKMTDKVEFFVKDFGYGIPEDQKDRIFQKFFRADNILSKSTDGTGLGLYIAQSIVGAHGGKMWFESEQDKGTTFYFTLSLSKNPNSEEQTLIQAN